MSKKYNITNPVYYDLKEHNLINDKNLFVLFPTTRDKKINVLKDKKSDIIFLEKKFFSKKKYVEKPDKAYQKVFNDKRTFYFNDDDKRRYNQFKKIIKSKEILDFGCGWGGFLYLSKNISKSAEGYEIMKSCVNFVKKNRKIKVYSKKNEIKKKFDVIFLFHVLEHIPYQIKLLKYLNSI